MAQTHLESYKKTFTAFAGADIVATFNGKIVGELQALSYNVTREKAPIYTLGNANPRSFSRGKRGIAGTMVFVVFDRDAFIAQMQTQGDEFKTYSTFSANVSEDSIYSGMSGWDEFMTKAVADSYNENTGVFDESAANNLVTDAEFEYPDQIPPFNVTVVFQNEYGQAAKLELLDVEILNYGMGFSVDDVTMEMACTFICRSMKHMRPITLKHVKGGWTSQGGQAEKVGVSMEGEL
jgi:hypothetical protein